MLIIIITDKVTCVVTDILRIDKIKCVHYHILMGILIIDKIEINQPGNIITYVFLVSLYKLLFDETKPMSVFSINLKCNT